MYFIYQLFANKNFLFCEFFDFFVFEAGIKVISHIFKFLKNSIFFKPFAYFK